MLRRILIGGLVAGTAVVVAACSDTSSPDGTGGGGTGGATASLDAVSPAPGASMVPTSTGITLTFGQPMMAGMSQYMDLHQGDITGPVMPMGCSWSAGNTVLSCTPNAPLAGGSQYTIHVGAGMVDSTGQRVGMGDWTGMGGHWATSSMMSGGMMGGGMHDGEPLDMMGSGWTHNGYYGMLFTFTTN